MNTQNIPCVKIDILKEDIVLPATANIITARRLNNLFSTTPSNRPSYMPPMPEAEKEIEIIEDKYHLHKFTDPTGTFKPTNFLVKHDELGLFTQLLLVQSQNMREMVERENKIAFEGGWKAAIDQIVPGEVDHAKCEERKLTIADIKALPWWKRLFNKF